MLHWILERFNKLFNGRQETGPTAEDPFVITLEDLSALWLEDQTGTDDAGEVKGQQPDKTDAARPTPPRSANLAGRQGRPLSLVEEFLDPNRHLLGAAWDPLVALCTFLEQHGSDCPSIVIAEGGRDRDEEAADLFTIRDSLARISLLDHTRRVTRHALVLLREQYRDPEPLIPKVLTVALGHDIGKAPVLRSSNLYTKSDHPEISAIKLSEIFSQYQIFWLEDALNSVRGHHRASSTQMTALLSRADQMARVDEVVMTTKDVQTQPWERWCTAEGLLPFIAEKVNVLQRGKEWEAVSVDSVVYCRPELLTEAAKRLAHKQRIIDLVLISKSGHDEAARRVIKVLSRAGHLAAEIGSGHSGLSYEVRSPNTGKTVRAYLAPIKIEAFGVRASEFERLKKGYLETITSISLARGGTRELSLFE
jgi:hypothetical protein